MAIMESHAVTDTFTRPCHDCGQTVRVAGGTEQPHECARFDTDAERMSAAWWAGHAAALHIEYDMTHLRATAPETTFPTGECGQMGETLSVTDDIGAVDCPQCSRRFDWFGVFAGAFGRADIFGKFTIKEREVFARLAEGRVREVLSRHGR